MSNLSTQLAEAEAKVAALRQRIEGATCAEAGHDWRQLGGKNAGCDRDCGCSVPVYVCDRCGDSDYGDNAEADETIRDCEARALDQGVGEP